MAARLIFVKGRAGAGKSRYLRHAIGEKCAALENCALLVPEQFTFEAERALSEKLPGGLMRAEVYSFTSLASRILEDAGVRTVFLSAQGRRMVLRRAAEECKKSLLAFQGVCERPGFAKSCDDIFSLYKRCELSPEDVWNAARSLGDDLLGRKMHDLALLYEKSEQAVEGKYMRAEDALFAVRAHIGASFLRGTHVYVDNCEFWAEQIYGILEEIMDCAASLTLCVRADFSEKCRDKRVFTTEYKAYERLLSLARAHGCRIEHIDLPIEGAPWEGERYDNPALSHLEHELFANPFTVYAGEAEGLYAYAAPDIALEAEAAADAVQRAARAGLRYRDMALVSCDFPAYAQTVQRALERRGIPYFTDAKQPLARYALSRLLRAALRAVTEGFKARELFEICKTGLAGVSREESEFFENYVLRRGLRAGAFAAPFIGADTPAEAESARLTLMEPLLKLQKALHAGKTAREKTEALYAYIDELGAREKTEALCEFLRESGRLGLMEENRQVYDTLMELFSQLHALMGDTPLSSRRFCALFEEGLAAYEIGVVPATADQLLFGSIDRTRARSIKALFLIGAGEGALPQSTHDDGLIDDEELLRLAEAGMRVWDDSATHAAIARMDAYMAVTKPKEMLYISCQTSGEALPSSVFERILAVFPSLKIESTLRDSIPADAEGGFMRLCGAMRTYADGASESPDPALYAWYAKNDAYAQRLSRVENAAFQKGGAAKLKGETAKALYQTGGSASRLESFNSCAFKHFARYGLKLEARREYGEKRTDEGNFCHEALAQFAELLCRRKDSLSSLTREDVNAMLDEIVPPLLQTHNGGILCEDARMRAKGRELAKRVEATAWAVTRQLAAGRFRPTGTELSFGRGGDLPGLRFSVNGTTYMLSGKIDRLDSFQSGAETYYRVVDYKSSDTGFDFADLYYGLKLQLPLYIAAVNELEGAVAAGVYYMHMDDPAIDEGLPFEEALVEKFRMKGLTLSEPLIEEASDEEGLGVLSARSGRIERPEMARLIAYARDKCRDTALRIQEGEIAARPMQRSTQRSACDYCEYKSLCRFDRRIPGFEYASVASMNKDEFMEKTDATMDRATE